MTEVPWPTRRQANLLLWVAVVVSLATGTWLFGSNASATPVLAVIHAITGMSLIALAPRKAITVRHGLARKRPDRWGSILLATTGVATVATGIAHTLGLRLVLGYPTMNLHVIVAIATGVLVIWHALVHPARPTRTDASRRSLLRLGTLGLAAAGIWGAIEGPNHWLGLPGRDRRKTGSHEVGSFDPQAMPGTIWFTDTVQHLDPDTHQISLPDRDLVAAEIPLAETWTATLDCTSGWYATQEWHGVDVVDLLGPPPDGAGSIVAVSATGYSRRFPTTEPLMIATHYGGEPLADRHGGPARLVAPGRRGFWWVKWLAELRYDPGPPWAQPPFPLT